MPPPPPILSAVDLSTAIGPQVLLEEVNFTLHQGDRVGVVGRNGAGKSTMLRILAAMQEAHSGEVRRRKGLRTTFLPQEFALDDAATAASNVRAGAAEAFAMLEQLEQVDESERLELEDTLTATNGWDVAVRQAKLMDALRIPQDTRPVSQLSGGERRRVAIARAMVAEPDLLILDEPTNHLDAETIEWLETVLTRFSGTLLLVTHDRYFLDRVCTRILELRAGTVELYPGNYTEYLIGSAEKQAAEKKHDDRRRSFLRRELDWVQRGPAARTTKSKGRLDRFYAAAAQSGPAVERDVELLLPPPERLGDRVVELSDVRLEVAGRCLVRQLNLELQAGQRLGIVGPNGAGKTTLIRTIMGERPPDHGQVQIGQRVQFNYIDQGRLLLNNEKTVLDEVGDGQRELLFGNRPVTVWSYLHRFLFTDDRINTLVKDLSGGERNRLLLAKQLIRGGNVLILDEPTNDLDLATLRVLEEALISFAGSILVVSHDRYFLNRVCTGIVAFVGDGELWYEPGSYDYFREQWKKRQPTGPKKVAEPKKTRQPRKKRRFSYKEQQELDGMEEAILVAEEAVNELEQTLADPGLYARDPKAAQELAAALHVAQQEAARLYERWEALEALQASLEAP